MRFTPIAGMLLVALCGATSAQPQTERFAISIYNGASSNSDALFAPNPDDNDTTSGYAVVRDRRQFDLVAGDNNLQVRDVARLLDPSAISIRAIPDDGIEILSQRFDSDPISLDSLVQRHLGHAVEVTTDGSNGNSTTLSGVLLSNAGGLTLRQADGHVTTITEYSRITFTDLPKDLSATPSLRWEAASKKAGSQTFEIIYPTHGLGWRAEYSAWLASGGDCSMNFAAWAQIANRSGTDFHGAKVKLIAGEPHRVAQNSRPRPMMMKARAGAVAAEESGNVGDYHEYTIDTPVDLFSGGLLRVALFPGQPLPCQRQYIFEGSSLRANQGMAPNVQREYGVDERAPVKSTLTLRVDRALPAGRIRVIQDASDGSPEFVGEDNVEHTPRNEPVSIDLGDAFDIRGERAQTDFQFDKDARTINESFSIRLVNRSAHEQTVVVREHFYRWTQWSITQSSEKYEKRNADTVDFKIAVPANADTKLTYTAQYKWNESYK